MTQNEMSTKLCHIVKRPDFDGYGFNLHSEKAKPGQFIGKVDINSPAEAAGLKEGDRIIEVNGQSIEGITHKQVVQRIKAIEMEVRLLLIDGTKLNTKNQENNNANINMTATVNNNAQKNANSKMAVTVPIPVPVPVLPINDDNEIIKHNTTTIDGVMSQILPGVSENINSITMVSTKRASQDSQHTDNTNSTLLINGHNDTDDEVDHSYNSSNNNNTNINTVKDNDEDTVKMILMNIPPPPSAITANNNIPNKIITTTTTNGTTLLQTNMTTETMNTSYTNELSPMAPTVTIHKAGSLQLPLTAAEMRAKLMAKKKYDPKNESVDLRKKYEIVQKL